MLEKLLKQSAEDAVSAALLLKTPEALSFMEQVARAMADTFQKGNKILLAGNGGSLCDAAHFAEELTGFFRKKRPALPALILNDPGHITCVSNDLGFEYIFSRGIEAFGKPGDMFIGLSTSGNSLNLVYAFEAAKKQGLTTVAFLGKKGGQIKGKADYEWIVDGFPFSDRIQEAHMAAIHILIEALEALLFSEKEATKKIDLAPVS